VKYATKGSRCNANSAPHTRRELHSKSESWSCHILTLYRVLPSEQENDMIRWALRRAIGKIERDWNTDASYMRDLIDASRRAAWLFFRAGALGRFRRDV
jgi:hypothetical protein